LAGFSAFLAPTHWQGSPLFEYFYSLILLYADTGNMSIVYEVKIFQNVVPHMARNAHHTFCADVQEPATAGSEKATPLGVFDCPRKRQSGAWGVPNERAWLE